MGFLDSLFGGDDTVTKTTQSNQSTASSGTIDKSIPSWLQGAAQGNITGLGGMSYTPFSGDRVAGLNPDEVQAGNMIRGLAGTPNAYQSMIEQAYGNAATAAPGQASTTRWYENLGPGGDISAYMDPYIMAALQPALQDIDDQSVQALKDLNRRATFSNAFGDARTGIEAGKLEENRLKQRQNVLGTGLSRAFSDAAARKQADIDRALKVQEINLGQNEAALARALQGGSALMGLDKYNVGREADLAGMLGQVGALARGLDQKGLDALYQEFTNATGFPLEVSKVLISAISGIAPSVGSARTTGQSTSTGTSTETAPDTSGSGLLGALAGGLGTALGGPLGGWVGSKLFS